MKGVMGGTCCKYTGEIEVCLGTSYGISLNGLGDLLARGLSTKIRVCV